MTSKRCLIFGGFGAIGSAVALEFEKNSFEVWRTSRSSRANEPKSIVAVGESVADATSFDLLPQFDAVVWAQGSNLNDSIIEFKSGDFDEVLNANVKFVVSTLSSLLAKNKVLPGAKICIVSSIWQDAIRPNKLSYSVSKSALSGLVKSVALDLSSQEIFVNAILPGVIDTPMTRGVLTEKQVLSVGERTSFGRLVRPEELANVIFFLCSDLNSCITGQSIVADLGFANVRPI